MNYDVYEWYIFTFNKLLIHNFIFNSSVTWILSFLVLPGAVSTQFPADQGPSCAGGGGGVGGAMLAAWPEKKIVNHRIKLPVACKIMS